MTNAWKNITVKVIGNAIFVPFGTGLTLHKNRQMHGLVFNGKVADKIYYFDDGTVLNTGEFELFYLPRGSSYRVKVADGKTGGCYAINFDTWEPFSDKPFCISFRDHEKILKAFKGAAASWEKRDELSSLGVTRQLYTIIYYMLSEAQREYVSSGASVKLKAAEEMIAARLSDPSLTVDDLAQAAGISGTYLRRLFFAVHGQNPKEYICSLREAKAKELLLYEYLPVAEVARLSGYSDVCHFSREFKSRVGITPAKFRRYKKN